MFDSIHDVSKSAWSSLRRFWKSLNGIRVFLMPLELEAVKGLGHVKIGASESLTRLLESLTVNGPTSLGESFPSTQVATLLPPASGPLVRGPCDREDLDCDWDTWVQGLVPIWQSAGCPWAHLTPFCHWWNEVAPKPLTHCLSPLEAGPHSFHCLISTLHYLTSFALSLSLQTATSV